MATSYHKLHEHISLLLNEKNHVFVAISGFGGSGKTTLADRLGQDFQVNQDQIIRIDHLYSLNPDGPGILDQVDWELLEEILTAAQSGKNLSFVGKGFNNEPIPINTLLPRLLIVEGIRLLQPKLLQYFDLSMWIDCPQDIAIKQAKKRDFDQGEDPKNIQRWDTDWGPKDKEYFETFRPDLLATYLL